MAGPVLCVSCVQLPIKKKAAATKVTRCPECQAAIGITSYGAVFRVRVEDKRFFLAPSLIQGLTVGIVGFMAVIALVGLGIWSSGPREDRPGAAVTPADKPTPQAGNHELARAREVSLHEPLPNDNSNGAKQKLRKLMDDIRVQNAEKRDGFLHAQLKERKDLRGMPFIMGDDCKLDMESGKQFQASVSRVRQAMDRDAGLGANDPHHATFWSTYNGRDNDASIAALSQILGPETVSFRATFVQQMAQSKLPAATTALAKAALFDASGDTRMAAIKALKGRPNAESSALLLHGLRYPLASVSKHAAQAMIMLDRKDLLPQVADFLGEAAPGDPVEATVEGEKVHQVRELVKINHHRNCLLCHAPVETAQSHEVPALMPTPGLPMPRSSQEYYGGPDMRTEPAVRADTTYLRQDFSVMMPVANAKPWPEMQRFDFLVRTRVVEAKELAQLQQKIKSRPAGHQSEQHKAALRVLRELTGQDAAPQPEAWRRVIGAVARE